MNLVDNKGLSFSGTFQQVKKSGEKIEVEIYSTLLAINERPCRTVIAIDVTEKNVAELKFTQAIIKTQEDESYAIGSELHDNICQIVAGSVLSLSSIQSGINEDAAIIFAQGISHIKLASNEIRNLSHRLAPASFDDIHLDESLFQLLSSINLEKRFKTHLAVDKGIRYIDVKRDLQINLYRIMQEQLNNIIKYSNATTIDISLSIISGNLTFEICDNGVGFDEKEVSKGIGFANMDRRAKLFSGCARIASSPNNGCKVTITIPSEHIT